ncbi:hypothetical protein [Kocuria rhizophila]|uniref:hypothetical protein n=1 Tax=Kocuria rhizophila TaxID=72000 RepID=UPI0011AF9362|nr:hypothetical protein [Kocuria rhizophila]MCT1957547.1 hypothetical protein [Kocuria rhizophila]MCT2074034.1 hypothetical protein [Kocuria rhizophila]
MGVSSIRSTHSAIPDMSPASRDSTLITHIYTFTWPPKHGVPEAGCTSALETDLELGRFNVHLGGSTASSQRILRTGKLRSDDIALEGRPIPHLPTEYRYRIAWDGQLSIQVHLLGETDAHDSDVNFELNVLCHRREDVLFEGEHLPQWAARQLGLNSPLLWDQDVLQIVDCGQAHLRALPTEPGARGLAIARTVLRDHAERYNFIPETVRRPRMLNISDEHVGAHGRGVILVGGHPPATANAIYLTSSTLLAAFSRLRALRTNIHRHFESLQSRTGVSESPPASDYHAIQNIAVLTRRLQLDLSIGVEAYIDDIEFPDMVIDEFRQSFADALGVETSLQRTRGMLDSLSKVSETYLVELRAQADSAEAARKERLQFAAMIATGLVFPFGLLFSFFGATTETDVPSTTSILNLGDYGLAWALAIAASVLILVYSLIFAVHNGIFRRTP